VAATAAVATRRSRSPKRPPAPRRRARRIVRSSLAGLARRDEALVAELASAFAGGARIVPLEGAQGPNAVALAIAQAFGVELTPGVTIGPQLARAHCERAGDPLGLALLLVTQGSASVLAGLHAHAALLLEDGRERLERLADADGVAVAHAKRGRLALHRGDLAAARAETQAARRWAAHRETLGGC